MLVKKRMIVGISVLVSALLIVLAVYTQVSASNKAIAEEIASNLEIIENESNKFNGSEDRNEKLSILSDLTALLDQYERSENPQDEVLNTYNQEISGMRTHFIENYDVALSNGTIVISEETSKEELAEKKDILMNNLEVIENEKNIVLAEEEIESYIVATNKIIKSYDNKLEEIKIVEEEARLAEEARIAEESRLAEEARKAQEQKEREIAEANKAAQNQVTSQSQSNKSNLGSGGGSSGKSNNSNNSNNSGSAGSSGSSGGSSGSSSGGGRNQTGTTWATDSNGNKISGSDVKHYDNGDVEDEDGEGFNMGDWFDEH